MLAYFVELTVFRVLLIVCSKIQTWPDPWNITGPTATVEVNSVVSWRLLTEAHALLVINVYRMGCLGEMLKRVLYFCEGGEYALHWCLCSCFVFWNSMNCWIWSLWCSRQHSQFFSVPWLATALCMLWMTPLSWGAQWGSAGKAILQLNPVFGVTHEIPGGYQIMLEV